MRDFKSRGKSAGKILVFFGILAAVFMVISKKIEQRFIENDHLVPSRNKSIFGVLREPENSIDVIVVGDSLSYSAISPMILWKNHGITSYVCGQSGQKIQETYHALETAFTAQSPKLVILETNTMFRGALEQGIVNLKETVEEWGNHYFPIFKGHDIWKSYVMNKEYVEENYKGFAFRCSVQPYENGTYMRETDKKARMPAAVIEYMDKIMDLCREKGAKLLLVSTPSPINYNYQRHNSIQDYAKKQDLDFLDLNLKLQEMRIDWKVDSLDKGDHLNLSGATKVTRQLGKYLSQQYDFQDHRNEEEYVQWQKEAEDYTAKAEKHLDVISAYKN